MNKQYTFEEDEEIIADYRRHPVVLAGPIIKVSIGFLIVILIFVIAKASWLFSLAFFSWLIIAGVYFFYNYYVWRKDAYIITDKRVIVREQKKFLYKKVSEASLKDITDVTYSIRGFWPTLFKYGTVKVQTASSDPLKIMEVAKPQKVQAIILDVRDRYLASNVNEMTAKELVEKIQKQEN